MTSKPIFSIEGSVIVLKLLKASIQMFRGRDEEFLAKFLGHYRGRGETLRSSDGHVYNSPTCDKCQHISQNAKVTSNKMVHKKKYHFLAQFSTPFLMVCSILLPVLASKTIKWKLLIGCKRISTV